MSYSDCRFSQNLGSMPKKIPSRSAVSAVMGRWPFTSSLIRLGETPMSAASWRALIPMGFMKSSSRISPGGSPASRAAATLADLHAVGVQPDRIKIIFNMVDDREPIDRAVHILLSFLEQKPIASANTDCRVGINEVYARVGGMAADLAEIARDETAKKRGRRARSWPPVDWLAASCPNSTRASPPRLKPRALRRGRGRRCGSGLVNEPMGAREALLIEAIGEMVNLIDSVDRLNQELREASREGGQARADLRGSLAAFSARRCSACKRCRTAQSAAGSRG